MANNTTQISETAEREIVISRLINAPRELVWQAWTQPEHIVQWWGPNGFTNTTEEMDVKPGGVWRSTMHGPDGVNYPNRIRYMEVVKPEKLVYLHDSDVDNDPEEFHVTVTFEAQAGKTLLTMRSVFKTAEVVEMIKKRGATEGGQQTISRMEGYLPTMSAAPHAGNKMSITRIFDAPRELVFKMWTDPEHVIHWWGPNGFTNTIQTMDVRPGGLWEFVMHGPDGTDFKNKSIYKEIIENEYLSFTHFNPNFETRVWFAEKGKKTELTWEMTFQSAEELEMVIKVFKADEGLKQNTDKLRIYLTGISATI